MIDSGEESNLFLEEMKNIVDVVGALLNFERYLRSFDLVTRPIDDAKGAVTDSSEKLVFADAPSDTEGFRFRFGRTHVRSERGERTDLLHSPFSSPASEPANHTPLQMLTYYTTIA